MSQTIVGIERIVRRMRGGSQSYLIQGDDGRFYVAKFTGNPQGNRTLVNEYIATNLLQKLAVSTPPLVFLAYDSSMQSGLSFRVGNRDIPVQSGLHLGSLCPVSPEEKAIFDFLPHKQLEKTINLEDFARMFVIDTFLHQMDRRQAIFIRARSASSLSFRAYFIDHGMMFGGSAWSFNTPRENYFYFDRLVYSKVQMSSVCELTVAQIQSLSESALYYGEADLPRSWLEPRDYDALTTLYASLSTRKKRLRELVSNQLKMLGINSRNSSMEVSPFSSDLIGRTPDSRAVPPFHSPINPLT